MKNKILIILSCISFLCFIQNSYAASIELEVGSSKSFYGNCVIREEDQVKYPGTISISSVGGDSSVTCSKEVDMIEILCTNSYTDENGQVHTLQPDIYDIKCIKEGTSSKPQEEKPSTCTDEKPCFKGKCEVTSGDLEKTGDVFYNDQSYTQFACKVNGGASVKCDEDGDGTKETTHVHDCIGLSEEIKYDVLLEGGNCNVTDTSVMQYVGSPETGKSGFLCLNPNKNVSIYCTNPSKNYLNYNCGDGTYADPEGNRYHNDENFYGEGEGGTETPEPNSEVLKGFCDVNKNPGVMRAFKAGGLALNILKIMIPILLIILGSIDFAQAVISNDEKQISKSTMKLGQRVIAGVAIFLVPTLIEYVFNLVDNTATNRYKACYECLLDVSKCPEIPKIGG